MTAVAREKQAANKNRARFVYGSVIGHVVTASLANVAAGTDPADRVSVNAGRAANLRMGTRVPILSTSYTPIATGGAGVNPLTSYQYQDVGTNIDCTTGLLDDGRFRLDLSIEDSSVEEPSRPTGDRPALRSFRVTNSLVVKDGQTAQFTTAVDKITGIVTKVDVMLSVVK
jgi:hypothetical protein